MTRVAIGPDFAMWDKASAQATFYFKTNRRRDYGNAEASLKAAWDGIVDSGLISDDNHTVLRHEATEFEIDRGNPRVEITIKKIT